MADKKKPAKYHVMPNGEKMPGAMHKKMGATSKKSVKSASKKKSK